ncbi:MAG: restriction endonuclease [Thermodesulfobacteriota bacterium]|nr:restriction endonuclease [Thermodesulfobacteriota bacterium]
MEDYLLSVLGIAISIILFFIGYRQTIGAKKERTKSANSEVEKILVRRIVLEDYTPKPIDISRLLEGKARDFKVKAGDLLSESGILNCIYTRIIETDLIAQEQREDILSRILPILDEAEGAPIQEQKVMELPSEQRKKNLYQTAVPFTIGIIASLIGGFVTIFPKIGAVDVNIEALFPAIAATAVISLTLISIIYTFYRLKESQQEVTVSSSSNAIAQAIDFERDVAKELEKKGIKVTPAGPRDRGYDFAIEQDGKKTIIEVKAWRHRVPISLLSRFVSLLDKVVGMENAEEGIIVTKIPVDLKALDLKSDKVRLMTLREFRNYLAHRPK